MRKNDPAGLRRRVLDVAADAFQRSGFAGTSMHDIQRRAGVTGGALHHHFPSKRDIGLAVIRERVSPVVEETWRTAMRDAPSAAAGILRVFERTRAELDARHAVQGCPLANLSGELTLADGAFQNALAEEYGAWRGIILERLAQERAEGGAAYAMPDPESFATLVVALFSGAMVLAKAQQSTAALAAAAAHLREVCREAG